MFFFLLLLSSLSSRVLLLKASSVNCEAISSCDECISISSCVWCHANQTLLQNNNHNHNNNNNQSTSNNDLSSISSNTNTSYSFCTRFNSTASTSHSSDTSNTINNICPSSFNEYFETCPKSNINPSDSKDDTNDEEKEDDGFIYGFFSKIHIPVWLQYVLDVIMIYPFVLCCFGAFSSIDGPVGKCFQILIGIIICPILPLIFVFGSLYQCLRCHHICWGKSPSRNDDDDQFKAYCNCFGTFVSIGFCLYFSSIYHNNLVLYWIGFIILLIGICLLSCCITTGIPGAFFGLLFLFVCDWGCDGNNDKEKCLGWLFSLLLLLFASGIIAIIVVTDTYDLVSMWSLLVLCALFIAWGIFFSVSFGSWLLLTWIKELFSKHIYDLTQFDNSANTNDELDDFDDELDTYTTDGKKSTKKEIEIGTALSVGDKNNNNSNSSNDNDDGFTINIYDNDENNTNINNNNNNDNKNQQNNKPSLASVVPSNSAFRAERVRSLDDDDEDYVD